MCLLLLSHLGHPGFPFVAAANRDEYRARPTETARFWPDAPQVLAGRDLEAGGTWLGITRQGRFAALTNFRDPSRHRSGTRSRGELVASFLQGSSKARDFLEGLSSVVDELNDFNLVAGVVGEELFYLSSIENRVRLLPPGIYGLSNSFLDTAWPKLSRAKQGFERILAGARGSFPAEEVFALLSDKAIAPDSALPRTGVPLEWERSLSAVFVETSVYGTRSSTLVALDNRRQARLIERSYFGPEGPEPSTVEYSFRLA